VIIVMAGLPGTGKSSIAAEIAKALGAVVLSKDVVRAAAFPDAARDYTTAQDDLAMEMIYMALRYLQQHSPQTPIVIDGRTFSKHAQLARLLEVTASLGVEPRILECVCDDETAQRRLRSAHASAANRDFELYRTLQREADPLTLERLTLDTGKLSLADAVQRSLQYLRERLH
jgi:predicted kinase